MCLSFPLSHHSEQTLGSSLGNTLHRVPTHHWVHAYILIKTILWTVEETRVPEELHVQRQRWESNPQPTNFGDVMQMCH